MFKKMRRVVACTVQALEPRWMFAALVSPFANGGLIKLAVGDVDGDGYADLYVIHRDLAARNILLTSYTNDRKGGFTRRDSVDLTPAEFEGLAIGDVNGDGYPDVVVASTASGLGAKPVVTEFPGDGTGAFQRDAQGKPVVSTLQLPAGISPIAIAAADLDGDGAADVAVLGSSQGGAGPAAGGAIAIIWGEGQGTKTAATEFAVLRQRAPVGSDCIFAGDCDGDGYADLVVTASSSPSVGSVKSNPNLITLTGFEKNRGGLSSVQSNPLYQGNTSVGQNPLFQGKQTLGLAHLNGPKAPCSLVGLSSSGNLYSCDFNTGPLKWMAPEAILSQGPAPTLPVINSIADLNNDGTDDFLCYSTKTDVWSYGITVGGSGASNSGGVGAGNAVTVNWSIIQQPQGSSPK